MRRSFVTRRLFTRLTSRADAEVRSVTLRRGLWPRRADGETPLAELQRRDDQHVPYRSAETTWMMPADGTGSPCRWLAAAGSPAVVRT